MCHFIWKHRTRGRNIHDKILKNENFSSTDLRRKISHYTSALIANPKIKTWISISFVQSGNLQHCVLGFFNSQHSPIKNKGSLHVSLCGQKCASKIFIVDSPNFVKYCFVGDHRIALCGRMSRRRPSSCEKNTIIRWRFAQRTSDNCLRPRIFVTIRAQWIGTTDHY